VAAAGDRNLIESHQAAVEEERRHGEDRVVAFETILWRTRRTSATIIFALLVISGMGCQMSASQPSAPKQWSTQPEMKIDRDKTYTAKVSTNMGDMDVELYAKEAPLTVNNFVFLAREGFYENVKFHRIIKGFMVQTGDPTGTGGGGPGYRFVDEPVTMNYDKGIVAMANAGENTNGSQFFVVHGDDVNQRLPKKYTIFGKVTNGLDVLDKIASVPVGNTPRGEPSLPSQDVKITKVAIQER
jgi:peptidylprolyl isomerase